MTDEPEVKKLENRIETLENTIEKMMPSRRDALKMGGAALAGGSLMAGTASAGTNQVGTIGSASQPVDLESEDINNADTVTTQDLVVNGTATGPFGSDLQGCRVILSNDQSISQFSDNRIQFDTVEYDAGNNYDTTNHLFTAPEDGLYFANLQCAYETNANTERVIFIGNDSTGLPNDNGARNRFVSETADARRLVTTMNQYQAGDTIVAYATNSDTNDSLRGGTPSPRATFFEVVFLGAL